VFVYEIHGASTFFPSSTFDSVCRAVVSFVPQAGAAYSITSTGAEMMSGPMRDGTVYHIGNSYAANVHMFEGAAEAIDFYHEHLLLKRAGEFDFSSWSRPL